MSSESMAKETFEDFRKSFFYGSRSDMTFKFLDHLTDREAAEFLAAYLTATTKAIDSGELGGLKQLLVQGQSAAHAHPTNFIYDDGPFSAFKKDIRDAKFSLLASSGHFPEKEDPQPFGENNFSQKDAEQRVMDFLKEEPVLSEISFYQKREQLQVRHGGYDTAATKEDPNITFPYQRLLELQLQGIIGTITENAYSFVGACSQKKLIKNTLPSWVKMMQNQEVDGVLLVPV